VYRHSYYSWGRKEVETRSAFVFSNVGNRNAYKISAEQYLEMCSFENMRVR